MRMDGIDRVIGRSARWTCKRVGSVPRHNLTDFPADRCQKLLKFLKHLQSIGVPLQQAIDLTAEGDVANLVPRIIFSGDAGYTTQLMGLRDERSFEVIHDLTVQPFRSIQLLAQC